MIKCPNCSAEVEYIEGECEFCCECGGELTPQTQEDNIPEPQLQSSSDDCAKDIFSNVDFAGIFGSKTPKFKSPFDDDWDLSAKAARIADDIDPDEPVSSSKSECPHLKVEYNQNLFFITDSKSVIKLKLTPTGNSLQDILIYMEAERDGGSHTRRQIPVREVLRKNRDIFLQIPFLPEDTPGRIFLVFYIGCKIDGVFEFYQFSVEHKIYDSKQSGTSLCSQITINQEFTSNHAADINYRDSIGDALKKMSEKTLSVNEMIDRLNDLPPKYEIRELSRTTWRPEDILIKGNLYPADKLMLNYNGMSIFLINKPSVKFGRDPEQVDLLVRCGRKSGDIANRTVSRKHAEIVYCDDTVKLFDYSTYGTYINNRKPDSAGVPLDTNALVEFGDIHWKMNIQKCNARLPHNICQLCSANKIKSVTFARTDDELEYYLLIWQCCELGRMIPELADWTIFSRNDCFFIRTPEQDFYHLRPGQSITFRDIKIDVTYFEQN